MRLQLGFNDPPLHLRLLGVRELLCNNCNLEFRGFALPGQIRRGKSYQHDESPNVRRAPRFKVKLPAHVRQVVRGHFGGEAEYSPAVNGHTRDISKIGLSLVLPAVQGYDLSDPEKRLQVWLRLPTGTVTMQVAPVSHTKAGGPGEGAQTFVLGAHIRSIGEADRAALYAYIKTLA